MTRGHSTACIALGSNLGDRHEYLTRALACIAALPETSLVAFSTFIETDPVGPVPQPGYLNAAAVIRTTLNPRGLLTSLLTIERSLGRDRAQEQRWGPRTLDLDLLLYDDLMLDQAGLTIPHPRMHERLFVLTPLAEVAPHFTVPGLRATVTELRDLLLARGTSDAASGSK